jgi:hypothetical protein
MSDGEDYDGVARADFLTLMSTWHSDESLEEAIWFLRTAFPLDTEIAAASYLAVSVENTEWAAEVDRAISDLSSLQL